MKRKVCKHNKGFIYSNNNDILTCKLCGTRFSNAIIDPLRRGKRITTAARNPRKRKTRQKPMTARNYFTRYDFRNPRKKKRKTTRVKRNPVAQYVIGVRERRGAKKWYVQAGKLIQEKRFADRFFSLHAARTVAKTTQRRINSSYALSNRFVSLGIEKS